MKKIVLIILIILIVIFTYFFINKEEKLEDMLKDVESEEFYINNYSIYGTHMSISGCINKILDNDLILVLKNNDNEITVESKFYKDNSKTCFYLSDKNNDGIYLDNLDTGDFLLLIKSVIDSKVYYYTLNNKTTYKDLEYYTITRNNINNKINVIFDKYQGKDYVKFKIKKEELPKNVYDIVIDPGHGGKDVGAIGTLNGEKYYESNLTLKISLLLKQELEKMGLKVALTRNGDDYLEPYGEGGRALIPNDLKSKYSLSIHLNSSTGKMSYGGVEVYVPNNINYEFANALASNLGKVVGYSKMPTNKISDGIYFTYFTKKDIEESSKEMIDKGMKPFDIKEGAPYMFMIREVGGINTSAYNDGRNSHYGFNAHYNSNQTAEPYLIEMAYLNYIKDLELVVNSPDKFSNAISEALREYLNLS